MEYKIVILPKAITDFEKSIDWYFKINSSLAKQFSNEIDNTIQFISKYPLLFQHSHNQYKSVNTPQFPFKIIYRIDEDKIIIAAIFHHKRNPKILSSRIK